MRMSRLLLALVLALPLAADTLAPSDFVQRREALAERVGDGFAVLECVKIDHDPDTDLIDARTPHFDFPYLTGVEAPGSILVVMPSVDECYLFLPEGEDLGEATRTSGIKNVLPLDHFPGFAKEVLGQAKRFYARKQQGLRKRLSLDSPGAKFQDLGEHVTALRMVKSPKELAILREAAEITCEGIVRGMEQCAPGKSEGVVEKAIEDVYWKRGAERAAFASICGSGPNTTILHYAKNTRTMDEDDLLVTDVGCELHGYAADVTRTYPVDGTFEGEQLEIYEIVREAQERARKALKPGISLAELDAIAREYIASRGYGEYFVHYLGHYVGLNVHDSGRMDVPLEPGMVITIEPGIYIREKELGVRIEDTFIVTEDGSECISDGAPRLPKEIEERMKR